VPATFPTRRGTPSTTVTASLHMSCKGVQSTLPDTIKTYSIVNSHHYTQWHTTRHLGALVGCWRSSEGGGPGERLTGCCTMLDHLALTLWQVSSAEGTAIVGQTNRPWQTAAAAPPAVSPGHEPPVIAVAAVLGHLAVHFYVNTWHL